MAYNHPWRSTHGMFSCKPDCPNRKPGCQDHCEHHLKEKAEWNKRKAADAADRLAKQYTYDHVGKVLDSQAKRERANRGRKWFSRGG